MREEKSKRVYKSRIERNSTKNRLKRRIKRNLKRLPKKVVENTIYLLVGLVYATYLLIRAFENLVVKLFMKLPRWSRSTIIWALVISNVYHNFDFEVLAKEVKNNTSIITTEAIPQENTPTLEKTTQNETKLQEKYECTLEHETACKIKNKAEEYNIDWKMAVAISRWETGNFTSNLYKNQNNVGGLYYNGKFMSFNTLDEGIEKFISNLKYNYFDLGLDTLEEIQRKYCPIGALNDPNCLNQYWLDGVTQIYNSLGESK